MAKFLIAEILRNKNFIKYTIAGFVATLFELLVMYILTDLNDWWYVYSSIVGFCFGFIISFFFRKYWAFKDYSLKNLHKQISLYFFIFVINLGLNTIAMVVLVDKLCIPYLCSQFLAGIFLGLMGFFFNKSVTFKPIAEGSPIYYDLKKKL